eukprot:CAMPEP_0178999858 /NCGR_PEP_ID=MMETSP0795-20121207/10331_1 /TAXON_ID=88552 /ORGANISM="Amoebophrya sp., Strain Ameob2" /LENGTH=288 /DNA_ID=CAMNT_0020692753 /DNA_START=136 /DNA_END=1002 /DNA_ORIENTATION=+
MASLFLLSHPQLLLHPDRLLDPDQSTRRQIDRICAFLGNAEGRDKIGKLVQFFARFLDGFFREGPGRRMLSEEQAVAYCNQLRQLWNGLQTARCWSWMGKSIIEWKTDIQTYENRVMPAEVKYLHMAARFFFAGRWFFENWMILVKEKCLLPRSKGGYLPLPDFPVLNRWAKRFWLAALSTAVLCECAKLRLVKKKYDAAKAVKDIRVEQPAADSKMKSSQATALAQAEEEIAKLKNDAKQRLRAIVMNATDTPSSISLGLDVPMSHMTVGGLMTIASFLQCQNLFPA